MNYTLIEALIKIASMDPEGRRADDLGRAAYIARDALATAGVQCTDWAAIGRQQHRDDARTPPHTRNEGIREGK